MKYEITQRRVNDEGHEGSEIEMRAGGFICHSLVTYEGWDFTEEELKQLLINDLQEYLDEYNHMLKLLKE